MPETPRLDVKKERDLPSSSPPEPVAPSLSPALATLLWPGGEEGRAAGLGFVLELAGGEERCQQEPDVELFCFQKVPNKPFGFPPSPGGKMPLYTQRTGCKNQRREGWKESALWDSRAGMGRHYTPGLIFVAPGKRGCWL